MWVVGRLLFLSPSLPEVYIFIYIFVCWVLEKGKEEGGREGNSVEFKKSTRVQICNSTSFCIGDALFGVWRHTHIFYNIMVNAL